MRLLFLRNIPRKSRCGNAMRSVDSECTEASLFSGVSSAETTTETAALGGCHQERHGWNGSSADGPEVVCGWPGGRLRMARRSSADGRGVRLRTTSGSSADGDSSSRMVNVVKRSGSALAGGRPLGRLLDPGPR